MLLRTIQAQNSHQVAHGSASPQSETGGVENLRERSPRGTVERLEVVPECNGYRHGVSRIAGMSLEN